jgi:hypothetical protein
MSWRNPPLTEALDKLNGMLADIPSAEEVKVYVERFKDCWVVGADVGDDWQEGMERCYETATELTSLSHLLHRSSQEDRRALIESAFGSPLPDGKPAGVYLDGKHTYQLRGRLLPSAVRVLGPGY